MAEMVIGEIRMMGFPRAPIGWLLCDGSSYPTASYGDLFGVIGYAYGGSGANFNVPDMGGRVPMHDGTGPGRSQRSIGQAGGSETVTLTADQLPAHNHSFSAVAGLADLNAPQLNQSILSNAQFDSIWMMPGKGTPEVMASQAIAMTGGNGPHDNTMPTQVINFCIAYAGDHP